MPDCLAERAGLMAGFLPATPPGRAARVQNGSPAVLSNQGSHPRSSPVTKKGPSGPFLVTGGEGGIRTRGTGLPYTCFPSKRLRPLGHLSVDFSAARLAARPPF